MLRNLDAIKSAATNGQAPHWFDRSTLRFFASRISEQVYPTQDGAYFVSSERYVPSGTRGWSVRHCTDAGEIITVGDFQQYGTRDAAHRAAARLAQGLPAEAEPFRWIVYLHQPFGGFEVQRAASLAEAADLLAEYSRAVYNDECTASLYPYSAEDWQGAQDFADTGCPFDYPSKISERGPRGGLRFVNA